MSILIMQWQLGAIGFWSDNLLSFRKFRAPYPVFPLSMDYAHVPIKKGRTMFEKVDYFPISA
jgi:hypothetical protein